VDDVWFQAELSEDLTSINGNFFARLDIEKNKVLGKAGVKLSLSLNNTVAFESVATINEDGLASTAFDIKDPSLWYPHGYGQQARYELKASLVVDGSEQSSQTKFVGFRKIELIQEKDEFGKSFYFRVNNMDVFAGGSCWIPADSFIPRIGPDGYRKWMELMVEGNQIMTRYANSGIIHEICPGM
jgi:beta-mannosidase